MRLLREANDLLNTFGVFYGIVTRIFHLCQTLYFPYLRGFAGCTYTCSHIYASGHCGLLFLTKKPECCRWNFIIPFLP